MAKGNSFIRVAFVLLATLARRTSAQIGPVDDLRIVNEVIAPDGFSRNTVLAGGTFPGPVISGYSVCSVALCSEKSSPIAGTCTRATPSRSTSKTSSPTPAC